MIVQVETTNVHVKDF